MPQYKLYYFDMLGLAEPIRLCFVQAGIPFEDIRYKHEEWPQHKEKMPFGQMPVLEVDGKKLTQSAAILRYIGKKYGLIADNEWDEAIGDELATSWLDMRLHIGPAMKETDKEAKKQKFQQAIEEFVKPRLKVINERVGESKTGFLAGNKVTWCDFSTYNVLYMIKDYIKVPLDPYPHLTKFMQNIENLPKIKEWQAKHKDVPFLVFPSPVE